MRLTPRMEGKAYFALTLINKELQEIILSFALLFAGFAILAPCAIAQQYGYNAITLTFDSKCKPGEDSKIQPSDERLRGSKPADFNRDIYYKNKLEFSLDGGWLPINVPFPFDVFEGDPYTLYPLRYTLVPIIASLRWHMTDLAGPRILRGNWDLTFSGSYTAIPRGPETRYFSYIMGIRRNFVPRNWRVAPYWDIRLGLGDINAKGPDGVRYAQGQDFTFTANMGSGVRYNFNPHYAISAGLNYMHISNAGLSGKKTNYGINVYGPMFGIDVQLPWHLRQSEQ
jgi:hypothetical protein